MRWTLGVSFDYPLALQHARRTKFDSAVSGDSKMGISEGLLPEFDHEMANTRKTLERVPDD
ncbi:MAG TPA: hypothetical protein VK747_15455, partial [Blastocatellia bacterium]|nr:hypothetical protein [Blastocatellia bacterium]